MFAAVASITFSRPRGLLLAVLEQYTELLDPMVVRPLFERVADPIERISASSADIGDS